MTAAVKGPRQRLRPTDRQVAALAALSDDDLFRHSREAMRALNRRAKEKRDRARQYRRCSFSGRVAEELALIYELKNEYLDAVVWQGLATVERFAVVRENQTYECHCCGRTWGARNGDAWCRDCASNTGALLSEASASEWFVVDCGDGFRFHQPAAFATGAMRSQAIDVEPHEPTQPRREIPNIGLTIEAQLRCVELMIERLEKDGTVEDE